MVGSINGTLGTIGSLSNQIIQAHAAGKSTADHYENQRNAALSSLSQPGRHPLSRTAQWGHADHHHERAGAPDHGDGAALATANANVGAGSSYPGGGIPPITMNGVDVTAALTGGQLGANIALRDQTLPGYQAQLDEFAETVSNRFAQQGLTLFTDPTGTVPTPRQARPPRPAMSAIAQHHSGQSGGRGAADAGAGRHANHRQPDNNDKVDALNTGLGSLVDADLAKSAQLQALQIRQQLGTQALSLANQAPQTLLSLFK